MICTNYDGPKSLLHSKFRENPQPVPEKNIFEGMLPCMGVALILVICRDQIFVPLLTEIPYKISFWLAMWFQRGGCLNIVKSGELINKVQNNID